MKKIGSVVYQCKNNFCAYLGKNFKVCECQIGFFLSDSNNYVKIKHHENTMFTKLHSKCDTIDGQATEKKNLVETASSLFFFGPGDLFFKQHDLTAIF